MPGQDHARRTRSAHGPRAGRSPSDAVPQPQDKQPTPAHSGDHQGVNPSGKADAKERPAVRSISVGHTPRHRELRRQRHQVARGTCQAWRKPRETPSERCDPLRSSLLIVLKSTTSVDPSLRVTSIEKEEDPFLTVIDRTSFPKTAFMGAPLEGVIWLFIGDYMRDRGRPEGSTSIGCYRRV